MLLTRKEAIMVSFRISGENMNDFTILHLPDLHFNKEGKQLPDLMVNLLSDIKEQLKYINNLIIVVQEIWYIEEIMNIKIRFLHSLRSCLT